MNRSVQTRHRSESQKSLVVTKSLFTLYGCKGPGEDVCLSVAVVEMRAALTAEFLAEVFVHFTSVIRDIIFSDAADGASSSEKYTRDKQQRKHQSRCSAFPRVALAERLTMRASLNSGATQKDQIHKVPWECSVFRYHRNRSLNHRVTERNRRFQRGGRRVRRGNHNSALVFSSAASAPSAFPIRLYSCHCLAHSAFALCALRVLRG